MESTSKVLILGEYVSDSFHYKINGNDMDPSFPMTNMRSLVKWGL